MKPIIIVGIILLIISFFAGRYFSGRSYDQREVDKLNTTIFQLQKVQDNHNTESRELYKRAQDERSEKLVIEQKYKDVLITNAKLTKSQKDTKAKSVLKVDGNDSSRFTGPVVDAVLTLDAENEKLEAESRADSLAFETLEEAYAALDSAYIDCDRVVAKKDEVIKAQAKKNRKPHWWELPLVGIALIGGFLLGSK